MTKLLANDNELVIWYGADRRVVVYPCDNNELLNFVCIHPEGDSQGGTTGMDLFAVTSTQVANTKKSGISKPR